MARSEAQNEALRQESRSKIKEAALIQFSIKGLFATRIQDIASQAKVSQGLVYRHYSAKEDIFVELISDALDLLNTAALELEMSNDVPEIKVRRAIESMLKTIETSDRFRMTSKLISHAMNSTAISDSVKDVIEKKREISYLCMKRIFEAGQLEKSIIPGDPMQLSILFWSTINGLTTYYATRNHFDYMPSAALIESFFIRSERRTPNEL